MKNPKFQLITYICLLLAIFSLQPCAQTPSEPQSLESNQTIEREMIGTETHRYKFDLKKDEFFQVRVEQKGVDVALKIFDAGRNQRVMMDSPNGKEGFETLSFVADKASGYILEISGFDEKAEKGIYTVKREGSRAATATDKRRVEIEKLFVEGIAARDEEGQSELAVKKLEESLIGWKELKDAYLTELTAAQIEQIKKVPENTDFRKMPINQTVESELSDDAVHYYIFSGNIPKQQVLRFEVEEKGVDIRLQFLTGTDRNDIKVFASSESGGGFEREAITFTADSEVFGVLAIRSVKQITSKQGSYKLKVSSGQTVTDADRLRIEAETLLYEGRQLDNGEAKSMENAALKYEQSLKIWQKLEDKYWMGYLNNQLGVLCLKRNDMKLAGRYLFAASIFFGDIKEEWSRANVASNVSQMAASSGDVSFALWILEKDVLPIFEKFDDIDAQSSANGNLGRVYLEGDDPAKALPFLQKSLAQARQMNNERREQTALLNLGGAYLLLGKTREGEESLKQAIQLASETGDTRVLSIATHNLSEAYRLKGNEIEAERLLREALFLERITGDKLAEARTLYQLASILENTKPYLSVLYAKMAVNLIQDLRGILGDINNETRKAFLGSVESSYRILIHLLLSQGRLPEAHQTLNRLKDQQAFDLKADALKKQLPLALTKREEKVFLDYELQSEQVTVIRRKSDEFYRKVGDRDPTQQEITELSQLKAQTEKIKQNFLGFFQKSAIEFAGPAPKNDTINDTPELRELQTALRELKNQTGENPVAIYTFITPEKFHSVVISADKINAVSQPVKNVDLSEKVVNMWGLLQSDRYDVRPLASQLYDVVFKPIKPVLPADTKTIMWSLDGTLSYIPMAALFDGEKFLVERYNHVLFTRAERERLTRNVSSMWTGTAFGNSKAQAVDLLGDGKTVTFSSLPGVAKELNSIFRKNEKDRGIFNGEVFFDKQFTKDAFYEAMKKRRPLIHIASHFSFTPGDEYSSFLLLGDGNILTLQEMKEKTDLFRDVELLTLSACNTAAQQSRYGREVDAFAELAQRLGAGAVMATLWQVSDASTPWLMKDFYENKQNRMNKAEALQKAQLGLLNGNAETITLSPKENGNVAKVKVVIVPKGKKRSEDKQTRSDVIYLDESDAPLYKSEGKPKYAHPYYWSPFVLYGNWR